MLMCVSMCVSVCTHVCMYGCRALCVFMCVPVRVCVFFLQGFLANASLRLGRQPTLEGRRREGGLRRGSERNEKRSTTPYVHGDLRQQL